MSSMPKGANKAENSRSLPGLPEARTTWRREELEAFIRWDCISATDRGRFRLAAAPGNAQICHKSAMCAGENRQLHPGFNPPMFEVDAPLTLATEFERIVRDGQLHPHYQLIADLFHGSILGYEGLIRGPRNSPLHMPSALFGTARKLGRLIELELACASASLRGFVQSGVRGKLLLNLSINTVLTCWNRWGAELPRHLLGDSGMPPGDLVIELTEQDAAGNDMDSLQQARLCLREHGIGLALDDYGTGNTNLQLWVSLQPDLVKI